jgi:nitrite reductase (cytochrome c-552)
MNFPPIEALVLGTAAENSTGFHAPQEAARILGESINFARQGQIAVRDRKTSRK